MENLTIHDLCTPALLLDIDQFESNLTKMASYARNAGVNLRPHTKSHKCPAIGRRQIEAGAAGLCVATLSEAEVMAEAGLPGILITSELVGEPKIERLMKLLKCHPDIMVVVDNAANVLELGQAAEANKAQVRLLIEIDVGSHRTGAAPGGPALELAQAIAKTRRLKLQGLLGYAGHAAHTVGFENRKAVSEQAMAKVLETQHLLKKNGIEAKLISGGSTGTYNIDSQIEGVSELEVGSYVFMDLDYRRIGGRGSDTYDDFGCALTVLSTVISRSYPDLAVVDAGFKAFSTDKPFTPECKTVGGITYSWGGDEHGKLNLTAADREVCLGERLEFIIPHCDPTVNLCDCLYGVRGQKVEAIWPIAARGHSPYQEDLSPAGSKHDM
jgi:D-serine deaminase-like pyridoxal phosphate-dependent protein